jgi:hypothetical protein
MVWRRNSRAARRVSWLAIFAILLQSLLPVFHHPVGMALAAQGGIAGEKIAGFDVTQYLCVAPGSTAPGDPTKVPDHHVQPCAICASIHAIGGFAPPTAPIVAINLHYGTVAPPTTVAVVLPRQRPNPRQQPRAPPVLI